MDRKGDQYELCGALAIYRMVFGQNRQEDLITFLLSQIPEDERVGIVAELQVDLSPANRLQRGQDDSGVPENECELAKSAAVSGNGTPSRAYP
jgi:hypothetical protein